MLVRRVWPSRASVWPPLPDLDQVRRDVFRVFDAFGEEPGAGVFPPANISQDDDHFYVRAELPGIDASALKITTAQTKLTLEGKRELPREERASHHRRERGEGAFSRTFVLPAPFDASKVEARYADGILTVVLPKAQEHKPRQIAVKLG